MARAVAELPDQLGDETRFVVVSLNPADHHIFGRDLILEERALNIQLAEMGVERVRIREYTTDPEVWLGRARVALADDHEPMPATYLFNGGEERAVPLPARRGRFVRIGLPGPVLPVPSGGGVIGRDAAVCQIVVDAPTVSRRHARIRPREAGFTVEDLDSANGVTINSRTTELGVLHHGDILGLGRQVRLRLELDD
ncbi:FHA domain-containing protein [Lentzea sp. NPDC058436]|uniref:FHA domain-containing protein n=1 Tax=Lentzea sp. NPDC058436 TaxID=3346499 RepID=UPI003655CDFB